MDTPWNDLERPPLRALPLRRALVGPGLWSRLDVVADTGSTNADLLADADAPDGAVLDRRPPGRRARPPRPDLVRAAALRPGRLGAAAPAAAGGGLVAAAAGHGLAVVDALDALGVAARLKWPNDVLVAGPDRPGKVCGILAEVRAGAGRAAGSSSGRGSTSRCAPTSSPSTPRRRWSWPGPAAPTATPSCGATCGPCAPASTRGRRGSRRCPDYRAVSATIGQDVRAQLPDGSALEALAVDVDDEGRLVVQGSDGARTSLSAADVVHLRRR